MGKKIFVINPGSTSTKMGFFNDREKVFQTDLEHPLEELSKYADVLDQVEYRKSMVDMIMKEKSIKPEDLDCVVSRGGLIPGVKPGGYAVNEEMKKTIREGKASPHASNLGALIAAELGEPIGIPVYIYDAPASDDIPEIARITGWPMIKRRSISHMLNMKAKARILSEQNGKEYENLNFIVCHMGGGVTLSAHEKGNVIDMVRDDEMVFAPERSGAAPALRIVDECFDSGKTKKEILKTLRGKGGLAGHLGTTDAREVENMIEKGDEKALLVYQAMAYNIARAIGAMAAVLKFDVDYIILTGGVAYSKMITGWITERVEKIAPVRIMAGENELEALAMGALRMIDGKEEAREYIYNSEFKI